MQSRKNLARKTLENFEEFRKDFKGFEDILNEIEAELKEIAK
ncbi:MAG: hypothetical protein ACFFCI_00685 [Promethearchaeota archaeon]